MKNVVDGKDKNHFLLLINTPGRLESNVHRGTLSHPRFEALIRKLQKWPIHFFPAFKKNCTPTFKQIVMPLYSVKFIELSYYKKMELKQLHSNHFWTKFSNVQWGSAIRNQSWNRSLHLYHPHDNAFSIKIDRQRCSVTHYHWDTRVLGFY